VFALPQRRRELGVEIVFISPKRHVSGYDQAPGFEYEKGDIVDYDIVLDKLAKERINHVIFTVSGFTFLRMFFEKCVLFPHSYPNPFIDLSKLHFLPTMMFLNIKGKTNHESGWPYYNFFSSKPLRSGTI